MRRTVIFQIVFILICLGCQPRPPGDERSTQTPTREAPATSTVLASSSPSPTLEAPAVTPTLPSLVIPHFANGQAVTITEIQMVDSLTGWALGVDDDARPGRSFLIAPMPGSCMSRAKVFLWALKR